MTGEVPAVHGGHVAGLERAEIARVIPVVEVAPEALEAPHRVERRHEPCEHVQAAEPAVIFTSESAAGGGVLEVTTARGVFEIEPRMSTE